MALYDIPLDLAVEAIGWVTDKVGMGGATAMCNVTVTKMDELLDAVLARINARTRGARVACRLRPGPLVEKRAVTVSFCPRDTFPFGVEMKKPGLDRSAQAKYWNAKVISNIVSLNLPFRKRVNAGSRSNRPRRTTEEPEKD